MKKVSIETLNENSLYHFTEQKNIEKIEKEGILPKIGENSRGIENSPKSFFSKGELGIIKVSEFWLRWLMNRIYGVNNRLGLYKNETEKEKEQRIKKWTKEFLEKEYLEDEEKKLRLFEYFYKYAQTRVYLVLYLEEGKDYYLDDEDDNKVNHKKATDKIAKAISKEIYAPFSNFESIQVDDWNMHTKTGTIIESKKINQVITPKKQEDMLSIILYVYEKNKNIPHSKLLLDDFIVFAKEKQKLEKRG